MPTPPFYCFTFEATGPEPHVNWVLYIPPERHADFAAKLAKWVQKVQGPLGPYDLHITGIDPTTYKSLAKYILKGTDPAFVQHFYLEKVHEPQGLFWGKRAGNSAAVDRAARAAAGFRPQRRRHHAPIYNEMRSLS